MLDRLVNREAVSTMGYIASGAIVGKLSGNMKNKMFPNVSERPAEPTNWVHVLGSVGALVTVSCAIMHPSTYETYPNLSHAAISTLAGAALTFVPTVTESEGYAIAGFSGGIAYLASPSYKLGAGLLVGAASFLWTKTSQATQVKSTLVAGVLMGAYCITNKVLTPKN